MKFMIGVASALASEGVSVAIVMEPPDMDATDNDEDEQEGQEREPQQSADPGPYRTLGCPL